MSDVASFVLLRDLRRDRSIAPGGTDFASFISVFLPLVYGSASALVPESMVAEVTLAVFRAFASRWRRLPKKTVAATWLLRSVIFASARAMRGHQPPPLKGSAPPAYQVLFGRLNKLREPTLNAVVLRLVLGVRVPEASRALRSRESRVAKRTTRGVAKLSKCLRKKKVEGDPVVLLAGICRPAPVEFENHIVTAMRDWSSRQKKDDLVRGTLRAWRWVEFKAALRRCVIGAATGFSVLAVSVVVLIWLATHGYLTEVFMRWQSKQMVKEFPDLSLPANPWPASPEAAKLAPAPRTAEELYNLTNIWIAQLNFTPEQWRAIAPAHIPPVPNMFQDGKMILRNPKAKRSGLAGVVGLDFNWTKAKLEFSGLELTNVAVRYRGNGTYLNSLFGPKQSFKVEVNKYVKGRSLAGIHTLNFVNSIPDNSYVHDALAEQLFRDLGVPAPRTTYAYLSVDVPGEFGHRPLGLYVLVEDIDANFTASRFGSKSVPIFKPVTTDLFKDLGGDWKAYAEIYDLKTKATPEQLERLMQFARLVTTANDAEFARRLPDFLNLEEFAGFLAGHVLLASYDGFLKNGQNFYLYLDPRDNKFGFIPWDQDHAWGEFGYVASADRREHASIWEPEAYSFQFLERVLKVEAFRKVYRQCLERALSEQFRPDRLYPQIDRLAALLRPAVAAESNFRLHRFDVAVSTNWISGERDGQPEGPKAPIHQIKRFITNRTQSVREQLDGKARGEVLR